MAITTLNNLSINRSDTAAADQVWTATSATASDFQAAAGGAWTFIKSQTATSAASVDWVNGTSDVVFDSTYIAYQLWAFSVVGATDTAVIRMLYSNDTGGSYETSGYKIRTIFSGGGVSAGAQTAEALYISNTGTTAGERCSFVYDFYNPAQTADFARGTWRTSYTDASSDIYSGTGATSYASTGAIDAFRIIMSTGNITGTFKLYGLSGS